MRTSVCVFLCMALLLLGCACNTPKPASSAMSVASEAPLPPSQSQTKPTPESTPQPVPSSPTIAPLPPRNPKAYQKLEIDEKVYGVPSVILDGTLLLENPFTYYLYDMATQQVDLVGTVEGIYLSPGIYAKVGNKLYFDAELSSDIADNNCLYELNPEGRTIRQVRAENLYQTLTFTEPIGQQLFSFKGNLEETYVEAYSPQNGDKKVLISKRGNEYILNMACWGTTVYVLVENTSGGQSDYYIEQYDTTGQLLRRINANPLGQFLQGNAVVNFCIMGGYAIINDLSGYGILFDLSGDIIEIKVSAQNTELASSAGTESTPSQYYVLYQRGKRGVLVLDTQQEKIFQIDFEFQTEDFVTGYVIHDSKQNIALHLWNTDGVNKAFYYLNILDYLNGASVAYDLTQKGAVYLK